MEKSYLLPQPMLDSQACSCDFPPEAVSVNRAAKMAGFGRSSLYEALKNGHLASIKIGRRRLILVATLRAWLKGQEQRTDTKA